LLASSEIAAASGARDTTPRADTQELSKSDHIVHMMWLSDNPQKHSNIRDVVSKAYEWAQLDPTVHVIAWHNKPERGDVSFPQEPGCPKKVTIRHISALCDVALKGISTLPCNISRKKENLADALSVVLPNLLGNGATAVNIYAQCDLAKILMMCYQAQKYPDKGLMYADLTIRPHKVSELWVAYKQDLELSGIVMANMAFPKSFKERQTMVDDDPQLREKGGESILNTTPGFENSAFLANCRHKVMLSVMCTTLLRPLTSRHINPSVLNSDHQCLFDLMNGSFFYLNLFTRGDERLSLIDPKSIFFACGADLFQQQTTMKADGSFLTCLEDYVSTDENAPIRLQGSLLEKYKKNDLLKAAVVETVMRGGFRQDIATGEIKMFSLFYYGDCGRSLRNHILREQEAEWYNIGDLPHLTIPIMDKHTLLTRESHFMSQQMHTCQ